MVDGVTNAAPNSGQQQPPPGFTHVRNGGLLKAWQKGQSGNPSGTNGYYGMARKLCQEQTLEATKRLFELMHDDNSRVSLMAVTTILDRGIGKPRDHSDEDNALSRLNLAALSGDEQRQLINLLRRVMGAASPAPQI